MIFISCQVLLAICLTIVANAAPAELQRRYGDPLDTWVTVDSSGSAKTIIPSITIANGKTSTLSPAPYATETGTRTSTPAVATAINAIGRGVFPLCDNKESETAPFCFPHNGAKLNPGKYYYITWDPASFGDNTTVSVQADYYEPTTADDDGPDGTLLTTDKLDAARGFFVWSVKQSDLHERAQNRVRIYLSPLSPSSSDPRPGPEVTVTTEVDEDEEEEGSENNGAAGGGGGGGGGGDGTNALVIALPVVLGLAALGLLGIVLWLRRRGKLAGLFGRSGAGYGVRQSRNQRVSGGVGRSALGSKGGADVGVELQDSPTSPRDRNVFREEVRRQERETSHM